MTSRVTDRNRTGGLIDALERSWPRVTVGVHADTGAQTHRGPTEGVTVADVAMFEEFGTSTRRPNAWLRPSIDSHRAELRGLLAGAAQRVLAAALRGSVAPELAARAFDGVAARARSIVQGRLRSLRGGIDTGHLLRSIEGRVEVGP